MHSAFRLGSSRAHRHVFLLLLRYTLKFGKVGYYLGYNALSDFFPTWPMRPNPVCTSNVCRQRQQQHAGWVAPEDLPEAEEKRAPVVHESNEVSALRQAGERAGAGGAQARHTCARKRAENSLHAPWETLTRALA